MKQSRYGSDKVFAVYHTMSLSEVLYLLNFCKGLLWHQSQDEWKLFTVGV